VRARGFTSVAPEKREFRLTHWIDDKKVVGLTSSTHAKDDSQVANCFLRVKRLLKLKM